MKPSRLLLICSLSFGLACHAVAQNTWTGGASTGAWNTAANWTSSTGAGVPASGSSLVFDNTGNGELTITDNFPTNNTGYGTITFNASAGSYILNTGASTQIRPGNITDSSLNTETINIKLVLSSATRTINVVSGGDLVLGGINSGGFGITYTGSGTLTFASGASNTYTGTTSINSGVVNYQNGTAFGGTSAIIIAAGAAAQVQGNITGGSQILTLSGSGGTNTTGALENVSGNNSYAGALVMAGAATISSDANTLTLTGGINNGGHLLTVAGAGNTLVNTTAISGTGGLTKNGTGALVLANSQSYTGATTVNSGTLEVDGALSGSSAVTVNGGALSGTGTIAGGLTVNAGGVTSPGVGSAPGVMTSDLAYSGSSAANFNVSSGSVAGTPQANLSKLYYSQMVVTGGSNVVNLGIGAGVTLGANSATSIAQTGSQIQGDGSSNSLVTLKVSLSSGDYATLVANASSTYDAKSANTGLDNYFVFNLGTGLATGRFTTLDINVGGADSTGTIYYSGPNDRFAADGVGNTIGDVVVNGEEFALSYTGSYGTNSTLGGNDIVLTAIPEPGTWGMILGGFGMLAGFRRMRKRRAV